MGAQGVQDPMFRSLKRLLIDAVERGMWRTADLYSLALIQRGLELRGQRACYGRSPVRPPRRPVKVKIRCGTDDQSQEHNPSPHCPLPSNLQTPL
jgi:hypothetical protein